MRYGIYSDIHANLEALQAVFDRFEKENVDEYICLGDIVGYGANPRECLQLVLEHKSLIVAGNHDYAVAGKLNIDFFNPYAKEAVLWTRKQLNEQELQYLANLDLIQKVENVLTIVHGTMNFPEMFDYIQTSYDAHLTLELLDTPVCFLGHSHVPVAFFQGPTVSFSMDEEFAVPKDGKTLVNVGSVGQPRDENPQACCAIYDDEAEKVSILRVEYDIEAAIKKITTSGLPEILGERLRYGR
ncbi:MAG: metallophosphoesterase family protein [Candidatus Brocadiae bacterium]|nr:metallophosphoesterase family protein [Candidatus Brocadiia bacterium]